MDQISTKPGKHLENHMNAISKENNPGITAKEFYFYQEARARASSCPHTDCMFNLWSATESCGDFARFEGGKKWRGYCDFSDKTVFFL